MILEFNTRQEAQTCLATINGMAADYWQSQGFTVIDGKELVGKRNGVDDLNSTRTISWDDITESPDGTWYFASLTGTRFDAAMQQLEANFNYTERTFPDEWVEEDVV